MVALIALVLGTLATLALLVIATSSFVVTCEVVEHLELLTKRLKAEQRIDQATRRTLRDMHGAANVVQS